MKVGDDGALVASNRKALADAIEVESISFMDQIHSAIMLPASGRPFTWGDDQQCDGIYLRRSDVDSQRALAVQMADCVPLILASPDVIAAVHIGREGLIKGMTESALNTLEALAMGAPLRAEIGPSICGDCYPLSAESFAQCAEKYPASVHSAAEQKVDVAAGVISILQDHGVKWDWFGGERECVSCDDRYFSYRRDRVTGRQAMVVAW